MPLSRTEMIARSPSRRTVSQIVPTDVGVLGGIGEQVGKHLREPHRVTGDRDGIGRHVDGQLVSSRVEDRTAGIDGRSNDGPEIQGFALDVDQSSRDARHFEQIVHQSHEVADLALHDCRHLRGDGVLEAGQLDQLQSRQQWRQGIPQLVTERGQELVLALIGEAQRFLGARPVLEVPADLVLALARTKCGADGAEKRGDAHRALQQRHVAERPDRFVERSGISAAARQDEHGKIGPRRLCREDFAQGRVAR